MLRLNLQFFSGEKTEPATEKKREETRKKGQVAKSVDIATAFILLTSFSILAILGRSFNERILRILHRSFEQNLNIEITQKTIYPIFLDLAQQVAWIVVPMLLGAMIAGLVANYMQVGVLFTLEPIQFKLDKLNPLSGLKRMFSLRSVIEMLKSMLKIILISIVAFSILWSNIGQIRELSGNTIGGILTVVGSLTIRIGLFAGGTLLVLAFIDYVYQKYEHEKGIRMSKQDIKDEYKKMEGDPEVKSKIKQKQREMAMRRMMSEVPNADVVITNPTHFAIALKYDDDKMDAPVIIGKGADLIAQKIKEIAKKNNIATVENKPLARALYNKVEIGDVVPEQFFKAVAEILAYVYRLKRKV